MRRCWRLLRGIAADKELAAWLLVFGKVLGTGCQPISECKTQKFCCETNHLENCCIVPSKHEMGSGKATWLHRTPFSG